MAVIQIPRASRGRPCLRVVQGTGQMQTRDSSIDVITGVWVERACARRAKRRPDAGVMSEHTFSCFGVPSVAPRA